MYALAADTDGIDGVKTTRRPDHPRHPGAGSRRRASGFHTDHLARHDAYSFFAPGLVVTGPTFTNGNDFQGALCTCWLTKARTAIAACIHRECVTDVTNRARAQGLP